MAVLGYSKLRQRYFATGFVVENHTPCSECVLGREKEWATFDEMLRCVSYFTFKGNVKLNCLLLRFL